jgi:hypothetical protein
MRYHLARLTDNRSSLQSTKEVPAGVQIFAGWSLVDPLPVDEKLDNTGVPAVSGFKSGSPPRQPIAQEDDVNGTPPRPGGDTSDNGDDGAVHAVHRCGPGLAVRSPLGQQNAVDLPRSQTN